MDENPTIRIPVAAIAARYDPFRDHGWGCGPLPREAVLDALAAGRLDPRPWDEVARAFGGAAPPDEDLRYHAERIAHLVANPDQAPILFATGGADASLRGFDVRDGSHRLAAAILRGDRWIEVEDDTEDGRHLGAIAALLGVAPGARGPFGGSWDGPISPDEAEANFRRWFGGSQVVDAEGRPLVVHHATLHAFDAFEPQRGGDAGFHFGSRAQAEMRAGRGGAVLEVYLSARRLKRVRDAGRWTKEQIRAARRQGYDGIVYLNRYEGMTSERVQALEAAGLLHRLDRMTDREFRLAVPEADDSFIVFEPTQIKSVHNPGSWSRTDPRIDDGGPLPEAPAASAAPSGTGRGGTPSLPGLPPGGTR